MTKAWQQYQAVYVHIPFCVQKCLYCDFASYARCSEAAKARYVEALCREIRQPLNLVVNPKATIYFGGGTPSTLSIEQLTAIVQTLKKQGLWQQPAEASIEVNPGTVDLPKLQALRELGFDRISMGVQSLNDTELRTIGRIHTGGQALEALALAKAAGFERINADVIYGLPGQTLASLQQTLTTLVQKELDHISVYGLIVEESTPLAALVKAGKLSLPDEDEAADMYDYVQEFLTKQGFVRYEISNYARRQGEKKKSGEMARLTDISYSKHNDVYWRYQPYVAFGASAASFDGRARYTRPAELEAYEQWVERLQTEALAVTDKAELTQASSYAEIAEPLSNKELLSEFMLMGLRRSEGADLQEAQQRFGVNVLDKYAEALQPYFEQKLIRYDETSKRLALTPAGMALGNQVFAVFV